MKRFLYKLAFWFLTLSWVGGSKGCPWTPVLYGPECYDDDDCGSGWVCMDESCVKHCESDVDCDGYTGEYSYYGYGYEEYSYDEYGYEEYGYYVDDSSVRKLCDPNLNLCFAVGCYFDKHCEEGHVCRDYACWQSCEKDGDCEELFICNTDLGVCEHSGLQCLRSEHCDTGSVCVENKCIVGECGTDEDCASDEICVGYHCVSGECTTDEDCASKYGEEAVCSETIYKCYVPSCSNDEICQAFYGETYYCRENRSCMDRGCSYTHDCLDAFGEGTTCDSEQSICVVETCAENPYICSRYYGVGWICHPDLGCMENHCEEDSYCRDLFGQDGFCEMEYSRCVVRDCTNDRSCQLYHGWSSDTEWFCSLRYEMCLPVDCHDDDDCLYDMVCEDHLCNYPTPEEDGDTDAETDSEDDENEPDLDGDAEDDEAGLDSDGDGDEDMTEDGDTDLDAAEDTEDETDDAPSRKE